MKFLTSLIAFKNQALFPVPILAMPGGSHLRAANYLQHPLQFFKWIRPVEEVDEGVIGATEDGNYIEGDAYEEDLNDRTDREEYNDNEINEDDFRMSSDHKKQRYFEGIF